MRDMPEHLPELPSGYVYAGRLGDYPECAQLTGYTYCNDGAGWVIGHYGGVGRKTGVTADWHFAAPVDSDIGRKILAERRPESRVEQEGHGTTRGDADAKSEAIRRAIEATAPEREAANLSLVIDASDVERALKKALDGLERKLPSMLPDAPDLIIPNEIMDGLDPRNFTEVAHESRLKGYRIEWDSNGIRGWKE